MSLIKHISIVSAILFSVGCSNVDNQISELGQRFIDEVFDESLEDVSYLLVLIPSQCESCIVKDIQVLEKITSAKNRSSFVIISSESMTEQFKDKFDLLRFESKSSNTLHRYGFVGGLGVLYDLIERKEVKLPLDNQANNLKVINTYCD